MPAAFAFLLAAGVGSVVYLLLLFNGQERGKRWRRAAEAAGLARVTPESILGIETKLTGTAHGLDVTLQRYQRGRHEHGTRITIGGLRHGTYALTLRAEGVTSHLEKTFGEREIELGDPAFDDAAYVQGAPGLVRAIFDAETRALVKQLLDGFVRADPEAAATRIRNFRVKVSSDELRVEIRSSLFDRTDDLLPAILGPLVELGRRLKRPDDVAARLAEHTRSEPLAAVRLANLRALTTEFVRHPATREALVAALGDTSPSVRLHAALSLGDDGRTTLDALATGDVPDTVAARAVSAIGATFTPAQATERLGRAMAAGASATALACVNVLAQAGGGVVVAELVRVLAASDPTLAAAAARALGAAGDPAAEGPLVEALAHEADGVRTAAALALGRVGTPLAVVPLREAASRHRLDGDLRRAVRQAIAEIQGRVSGASPGQVSLAAAQDGQISLVDDHDVTGRLSLGQGQEHEQAEKEAGEVEASAHRRAAQAARRQAQ